MKNYLLILVTLIGFAGFSQQEIAKKIVKHVKDTKMKVQASIKADEVRVDGKKRDDLQEAMTLLRAANFDIPLQFINFRE